MLKTQELSSTKYMQHFYKDEIRELKRQRNRKAIGDLLTFVFGLVAMAVGIYLVQAMPIWLPRIQRFITSF